MRQDRKELRRRLNQEWEAEFGELDSDVLDWAERVCMAEIERARGDSLEKKLTQAFRDAVKEAKL